MRAAIYIETGQPVIVEEVTAIDPGPDDVVVRIGASGVCHSDLSAVDGVLGMRPPLILGHEGAGTVEWVGAEVTRVKPGDRVIAALTPICGACWHCTRNETHLCERQQELGSRRRAMRGDGSKMKALSALGTFADSMITSQHSVVPVQTDLPDEQLALLGCGVTTGVGAVLNTAGVTPGATVAVIGCGGVGTSVVQGAHIAGAAQIIVIDPIADKRKTALRLGATDNLDPAAGDVVEQIKALTGGRGVDFAFEAVGRQPLMEQAIAVTRRGGTTVLVGLPRFDTILSVAAMPLIGSDVTIKGCYYGSARALRDLPRFVSLIEAGRLDLGSMVSKRFCLNDVNDAFDEIRSGSVIRSVIV